MAANSAAMSVASGNTSWMAVDPSSAGSIESFSYVESVSPLQPAGDGGALLEGRPQPHQSILRMFFLQQLLEIYVVNLLTQPMANRLKLLGITYFNRKNMEKSSSNFYFVVQNG